MQKSHPQGGFFVYNTIMATSKENQKRLAREWYLRNKELAKERAKAWALANPEKVAKKNKKYKNKNKEKVTEYNKQWWSENKDKRAAYEGKRRSMQLQRTPTWDPDAHLIAAKYQLAAMLSEASGVHYHVDHIIPLQGKKVSGLHVFSNLRVIPGTENVKKSNKYPI
jgi:hypothetical protein